MFPNVYFDKAMLPYDINEEITSIYRDLIKLAFVNIICMHFERLCKIFSLLTFFEITIN